MDLPHLTDAAAAADSPSLRRLASGEPVFVESREEYLRLFPDPRLAPVPGQEAWAMLPLSVGDELIGSCTIALPAPPRPFSSDDRTVLTAASGALAQAFARAQLFDSRRRYLTELQRLMLPGRLPRMPGLEVTARYRPGSAGLDVGGDWYDVLRAARRAGGHGHRRRAGPQRPRRRRHGAAAHRHAHPGGRGPRPRAN